MFLADCSIFYDGHRTEFRIVREDDDELFKVHFWRDGVAAGAVQLDLPGNTHPEALALLALKAKREAEFLAGVRYQDQQRDNQKKATGWLLAIIGVAVLIAWGFYCVMALH